MIQLGGNYRGIQQAQRQDSSITTIRAIQCYFTDIGSTAREKCVFVIMSILALRNTNVHSADPSSTQCLVTAHIQTARWYGVKGQAALLRG